MDESELRTYLEDCQAAIHEAAINMDNHIAMHNLVAIKACAEIIKTNAEMIIEAIEAQKVEAVE